MLLATGLVAGQARAAGGDAEAGRKLAQEQCSRCHVVGDRNPLGGIDSTPSFPRLAKFDDYYARFQTFYERRPHPVFVRIEGRAHDSGVASLGAAILTITVEQVDDLLAYIETLRAME
jgi:mono/diheme cytochrome c family protein